MNIDESHKLFASIGKISAAGHSFQDTVDGIMEEIKLYFQPTHCSLFRLDENTDELFFASILGMDIDKVKSIRLKINEGIAGKVAASQKSYFVPDTTKDPNFSRKVDQVTGFLTKSIIAVPLIYQKKTHGVIEIVNRINGIPYTESDHLILQTIADFAAISLYNASLYEQLMMQVHFDPLTGLLNRARLNLEIERHAKNHPESRREFEDRVLSAILFDLNNFKNINDTYGHQIGDRVLRDTALRLKRLARDQDLVFRIGGDEFLIIIYSNTNDDAQNTIKRIDEKISPLKQELASLEIPYGFSYGVATGNPESFEHIIHQADLNMYKKKQPDSEIT